MVYLMIPMALIWCYEFVKSIDMFKNREYAVVCYPNAKHMDN